MFVLAELKDTVRIPPWKFKRKLNDAITDELNRKLANKVTGRPKFFFSSSTPQQYVKNFRYI